MIKFAAILAASAMSANAWVEWDQNDFNLGFGGYDNNGWAGDFGEFNNGYGQHNNAYGQNNLFGQEHNLYGQN